VLRIYDRNNQKTAIQFADYVLSRLPFQVQTIQTDIQAVFVPGCRALSGRRCEASWVTGACPLSLMTDRSAAA
jgi:hypothetical protein